jgi:hypothetical protein
LNCLFARSAFGVEEEAFLFIYLFYIVVWLACTNKFWNTSRGIQVEKIASSEKFISQLRPRSGGRLENGRPG